MRIREKFQKSKDASCHFGIYTKMKIPNECSSNSTYKHYYLKNIVRMQIQIQEV